MQDMPNVQVSCNLFVVLQLDDIPVVFVFTWKVLLVCLRYRFVM